MYDPSVAARWRLSNALGVSDEDRPIPCPVVRPRSPRDSKPRAGRRDQDREIHPQRVDARHLFRGGDGDRHRQRQVRLPRWRRRRG